MSAPPEPKQVGRGLDAPQKSPSDPQHHLAGSHHPYAPFVGNALKWDSYVYDDATTYEGLTREDIPHGKGILVFGNGLGGGIQQADRGDRYEGEFYGGFASGLGQYTGTNGEVFRGEWLWGKRHGCGVMLDMAPFHEKVEKGVAPDTAWEQTKDKIEGKARYGTWKTDYFVSAPDESARFCHMLEIKGVLQELESVVTRARMFQYKPDGEVTFRMALDAVGQPAPLMQDPIHYPPGTRFLAPGPMGQCYPLPEDEHLRSEMLKHADNHQRIYDMYNFDPVTVPGSDMDKAEKLWRKQQLKRLRAQQRQQQMERRRLQRLEKTNRRPGSAPVEDGPPEPASPAEEEDIDDEDLIASTVGVEDSLEQFSSSSGRQRGGLPLPTAFASLSLSVSRASMIAQSVWRHYAVRAQQRRSLTRPSHDLPCA